MFAEQPRDNDIFEGRRFCGWHTRLELDQACADIVNSALFQSNNFRMAQGRNAQEIKFYKVQRYKFTRARKEGACQCPSTPLVYLLNKKSEDDLPTAIISEENFISQQITDRQTESTWRNDCRVRCNNCCCSEETADECKTCCNEFCECCGGCALLTCACIVQKVVCLPCSAWNCAACFIFWPLYYCGMEPPYIRWQRSTTSS